MNFTLYFMNTMNSYIEFMYFFLFEMYSFKEVEKLLWTRLNYKVKKTINLDSMTKFNDCIKNKARSDTSLKDL